MYVQVVYITVKTTHIYFKKCNGVSASMEQDIIIV